MGHGTDQQPQQPTPAVTSVIAEQQRINELVGRLRIGETKVISGTAVTVIDLATADRIAAETNSARGDWRRAGKDGAS